MKHCAAVAACCLSAGVLLAQDTAPPPAENAGAAPAGTAATDPAAVPDTYTAREKGIWALNDGALKAAAKLFEEYRAATAHAEPSFAEATALLVQAYLRDGLVERAVEAVGYHKQHSKDLTDPYYLARLTYWRGAVLMAQRKWAEAAALVTPVTESAAAAEYRALALELLGDAYVRLQDWQQAEAALTRLLMADPSPEDALRAKLGLIRVYLAGSKADQAASVMQDVDQNHPGAPKLTMDLYRVLLSVRRGDPDGALTAYRKIESERPPKPEPNWWMATSQLGALLMDKTRHEEALAVLAHAFHLASTEPDRIQTRLRVAECLIALEKVELAINALGTLKKDYPGAPQLVPVELQLAELLRRTKSFVSASECFASVADNKEAPPDLRYRAALSRGWCLNEGGQYENAVRAFAAAAKLGQTPEQQAEALFLAGDAAFKLEDFTNAALHYQSVADNFPNTSVAERGRYNQALSRSRAKLFSSAATVYKQFLTDFSGSKLTEDARIERGVALKNAGDFAQAAEELGDFAEAYPTSERAPLALMKAYESAMGADDVPQAIDMLSRLIQQYSESDRYPLALYHRAHVLFFETKYDDAIKDCNLFLDRFPQMLMGTDILMWLGDHYASTGNPLASEEHFRRLVTTHPTSPDAATAQYEAAKSAYDRRDLDLASRLLKQLLNPGYPSPPPPRIQTLAGILHGDILAEQGKFTEAVPLFTQARAAAKDKERGYAALGRLGDMHYSLGSEDKDELPKALECYRGITDAPDAPPELAEMARYRMGKTYEKLGEPDAAIIQYLKIVYQFTAQRIEGKVRDWYYFARSGHDAAKLFLLQEQYEEAARLYGRLAAANIPTAAEAAAKAREIRESHGLTQ